MPYAIAANAIPIIAFAPITNQWFGLLNPLSKMVIAAVLCFFPVLVNTLRGLTSVRPAVDRADALATRPASVEIFRRVRIPNSLPYLFTALKVASVLAMIGAVVGEYFGGSQEALGVQIRNSAALFRVRDGLGGDPRREPARDRVLPARSASWSASTLGWDRRRGE